MKSTKSTGWDTISMKTLKCIQKQIEPAVLNLINSTIQMQQYPDNLKASKAIPLLKDNKPMDKAVGNQVIEYLNKNDLVPHNHHGGRTKRSTVTALATMLDKWSESYENKKELAIIVLYQSAAYDIIKHDLLIRKMETLGFQEHTLNYFRSYLSKRRQAVLVDGFKSEELYLEKLSVIQGSVLSCLMYLIYVLNPPPYLL